MNQRFFTLRRIQKDPAFEVLFGNLGLLRPTRPTRARPEDAPEIRLEVDEAAR